MGYRSAFSRVSGASWVNIGAGGVVQGAVGRRAFLSTNDNRTQLEFSGSNLSTLLAGQAATLAHFVYFPLGNSVNHGFSRFGSSGELSHYGFSGTMYIDAFRTSRESFAVPNEVFARPHVVSIAHGFRWRAYAGGVMRHDTTASWGLYSTPILYGNTSAAAAHTGMNEWVFGSAIWARELSPSENQALDENFNQIFRPRRTITYSLPSSGATYNEGVTETAAANDSVASAAVFPRAVTESGSAADTVNATCVFTRAIAESASAADSVASGAGVYAVSVSEAASAADTVASLAVLAGVLTEAGAAADTVNATRVGTSSITETAGAADAVAAGANIYAVSVSEAASATDSVATLAVLTGSVAESAAAADAVVAQLVAQSAIVETGLALDLMAASGGIVISNIFRAAVNDALAFRCVCSDQELAA